MSSRPNFSLFKNISSATYTVKVMDFHKVKDKVTLFLVDSVIHVTFVSFFTFIADVT